ncbi:MAG: molybdenum cofactor biosynthesis F family protein [Actinomycetota bacterium]|nr:molybdenum cofactor biosynthesis F family protein [Actinomycetota bacterium]
MTEGFDAGSGQPRPDGWKAMDDFAAGIDNNRLPRTGELAGRNIAVTDADGTIELEFSSADAVLWTDSNGTGPAWYEAVAVRPDVYFLTISAAADPLGADVLALHTGLGRSLRIRSRIADAPTPGRPRVDQRFLPGVIDGATPTGAEPAPTRDLIGLRALYRYSPNHLYEHVYLSSERYAWQCLVGEQRGHGDVDLASTWKLAEDLYVFTFREFIIPVAATWLYDFAAARTTGTFLGLGGDGTVQLSPGGGEIIQLGRVSYPDAQPV